MLPYILTDNSLTIVVDGKALTMESSNPSFNEATKLLAEERFDELPDLFDIPWSGVKEIMVDSGNKPNLWLTWLEL